MTFNLKQKSGYPMQCYSFSCRKRNAVLVRQLLLLVYYVCGQQGRYHQCTCVVGLKEDADHLCRFVGVSNKSENVYIYILCSWYRASL